MGLTLTIRHGLPVNIRRGPDAGPKPLADPSKPRGRGSRPIVAARVTHDAPDAARVTWQWSRSRPSPLRRIWPDLGVPVGCRRVSRQGRSGNLWKVHGATRRCGLNCEDRYRPGTAASPIPIARNEGVRARQRGAGAGSREEVVCPVVWPRSAAFGAFDRHQWQVGFPGRT